MLRRSALVIAVVAAACIKLSEFHPLDAPGSGTPDAHTADAALPGECGNGAADQATALMSGTSVCAAGPGYVLRFPARGFDYPDQLRIGSQDLLGTTTTCNEDDRVGITVYPIARFSSDTVATGETASATIVLAGPVVAKVVVNWSWQPAAACTSSGAFMGSSMFTLFPDGRLVRYDQLTTPSVTSQMPCDCGSGGQAFFPSAYMTFESGMTITDQSGTTVAPGTSHGTDLPALVCASDSGWAIGVAQQNPARGRIMPDGGAIALTEDFGTLGATSLSAGTQSATTAYQIGTAPCSAAIAAVAQYDNPGGHQLHVTNDSGFDTLVPTENDGMYGGDGGTGGALQVSGTLTLKTDTGPIAPGWALSVTGATLLPPTAIPARTGDWYKIQNSANRSIIWFRDGLTGSDTITVPTT